MSKKIVLLKGDGIGPVLCDRIGEVLEQLSERLGLDLTVETQDFGRACCEECGTPLPDATVRAVQTAEAALLFAVDAQNVPSPTPVGRLRKELGLYAEVRAVRAVPWRWALRPDIDLVFVREITQGFLSDRNLFRGNGEWMTDANTAMSLRVITYDASRRVADYAFDYAERMGYASVTAAHKAAIFQETCGVFLRACRDAAKEHPSIVYREMAADDVAGQLVAAPETFDVIVTTNLFGDILSDEGAALVSGECVGINLGEHGCVYMPVRHSAEYDALKKDSYDPRPALFCTTQLLRQMKLPAAAQHLEQAVIRSEYAQPTSQFFARLTREIQNVETI